MKIVVAGASGLLGSAIVPHLESRGHSVVRLVRGQVKDPQREIAWDPSRGRIDAAAMSGVEGVINLSGENLGSGLWTEQKKRKILASRVDSTKLLAETIAKMEPRPSVLLSASASGYYGNTGSETITENAPSGETFLARVCREWEEATAAASEAGVRVAIFRLGVVLSKAGGMLNMIRPLFRMGLGGKLGSGTQYLPWVAREDVARAMEFMIGNEQVRGAVNLVSPNPVTNAEFTKALAGVLHRPSFLSAPEPILRGVLGEMAEEMLLASCRAVPQRLTEYGFRFKHIEMRETLQGILSRND